MIGTPGLSVRWSVTGRCPFRCRYCRSAADDPAGAPAGELAPSEIADWLGIIHREFGIRSLRFTGGEPLLRRDLERIVAAAADLGIPDIALTTNGAGLADRARALRDAGLQRVNVSLDALDDAVFAEITRGGILRRTLDGIAAARAAGLSPIKLNAVVLRGLNDGEIERLLNFGLGIGAHVRFLELMPIGVAREEFDARFVSSDEVRLRLANTGTWTRLPDTDQSTSRNWGVRDMRGRETVCGFISPHSRPFCAACRRLRLTADGRLIGCLMRGGAIDLRPAMARALCGDPEPLRERVERAAGLKRGGTSAAAGRRMAAVGG